MEGSGGGNPPKFPAGSTLGSFCAPPGAGKAVGTHVVEQSFLGVLPEFLVERLLENAHPGRHEQGEGEGSDACKASTARGKHLELTKFAFQGTKKPNRTAQSW